MLVLELKIVFEFKLREYGSGPQRNYIRKGKGLSL